MYRINNNYWYSRRRLYILSLICTSLTIPLFLVMRVEYDFFRIYSIPSIILAFLMIIFFPIGFGFIPKYILFNRDKIILVSKLRQKEIRMNDVIGYDQDYQGNKRLITKKNRKTNVFPLGNLTIEDQKRIVNEFELEQYEFKLLPPWGANKKEIKY